MIQAQLYKANGTRVRANDLGTRVQSPSTCGCQRCVEVLIPNWDNCRYNTELGLDPIDSQSCFP